MKQSRAASGRMESDDGDDDVPLVSVQHCTGIYRMEVYCTVLFETTFQEVRVIVLSYLE